MQIILKAFIVFGLSFSMMPDTIPTENPCNIMFPRVGAENWGNGLYLLSNNSEIPVYKDEKGTPFGKLSKDNNYFRFWDKNGSRRSLQYGDIEYIGHYSMSFIKVRGSKESKYLQIFWNSFEDGLFIKKTDLTRIKARFFSYKELLYNEEIPIEIEEYRNWASIGVNLNRNCLNLRKGPSTDDGVISCVKSNKEKGGEFSHFSILETKKDWAKVEVVTYVMSDNAESECDYAEHSKQVGWIKAIDNNGFPNIWYSVMNS